MSIIALLTDFGTKDYFVGAMKGVILSIKPDAQTVDITHEIEPQNIRAAGFNLRACYQNFPPQTIFVAVVDPGVGSSRRAIVVKTESYFFIAPDNGLLEFIFHSDQNFDVYQLTDKKYFRPTLSRTFHGRDVFAPVAAHLASGIAPGKFGEKIRDFVRAAEILPKILDENWLEAEIIQIDRFGNLITNLRLNDLPEKFSVEINGHQIEKKYDYFAEALIGEIFLIEGSADFLEIAARDNSAAKLLKISNTQKIYVKNKL